MNRLKKHCSTLRLLHKAKPSLQKAIIERGPDDLIRCLCDCSLNILKGNLKVSPALKKKLSRHKETFRKLVDRNVSLKSKRKLVQRGGFLGAILSALVPALGGLIGGLAK